MKKINNLQELQAERLRLKLELLKSEEVLKEDLEFVKEEIKPLITVAGVLRNIFINKKDGILNEGLRTTIDFFLKNILLTRSGWITRLVVPFVVKNLTTNFLYENKPEIFDILRNLIHKARKSTGHHNENGNYDKSTVDEMDY